MARDIFLLYFAQASAYIFPLITLPYLTRVLGPEGFGMVAFAQSYSLWIAIFVEYGFQYWGSRAIAQNRNNISKLADIVAQVHGVRLVLSLGISLATIAAVLFVPAFHEKPCAALWALVSAIASGLNPLWYYQGLERLRVMAALAILTRGLGSVGIFLFISSPQDTIVAIAIYAISAVATTSVGILGIYQRVPFIIPKSVQVRQVLLEGFSLFLGKGIGSLYTVFNVFLLGLLAPISQVALFAGAERLIRGALALLWPIADAFYPKVARTIKDQLREANILGRTAILLQSILGVLLCLCLYVLAPSATERILGSSFKHATPILRILAFLLPIVAFSSALAHNIMLPRQMDREYTLTVILAATVNALFAVLLTPRWGALGFAIAIVFAESCALVLRLLILAQVFKRRSLQYGRNYLR